MIITADGEVIFPDLPHEMLEVAIALDPDDPNLLDRRRPRP